MLRAFVFFAGLMSLGVPLALLMKTGERDPDAAMVHLFSRLTPQQLLRLEAFMLGGLLLLSVALVTP